MVLKSDWKTLFRKSRNQTITTTTGNTDTERRVEDINVARKCDHIVQILNTFLIMVCVCVQ